jgi:heat shock protein HtpX
VMEMCLDNPREGFGELFDTHPSVERRVAALVKFAGGHDPGPIALPPLGREDEQANRDEEPSDGKQAPTEGPWGSPAGDGAGESNDGNPLSPSLPSAPADNADSGPWGPHRG